jgi:iron(III) transport system ATP-binding protein
MPAEKRNTGMVFQSYALWPHMTVSKNVSFGLMMKKIIGPNIEKRAIDALERVQMAGYSDRKPTQLSGGQQQRVALARAMVIEPNVLLLDEPLSNLDAKLRVELRAEIKDVCKSTGMTAIYVTHDQAEALSMADRIAIMRSGRVIQTGTPRDLYESPRSAFVAHFLGDSNVLRGTVLQVGKVTCDVEVLGIQMCVSNDRVLGTISSGQPIELHCRPENVIVDGGGMQQSHLTIHAALEGVEYLGAHARCTYRVEIGTLISAMIPGHKFEIPTHAQLTIPGSQLSILPIEN